MDILIAYLDKLVTMKMTTAPLPEQQPGSIDFEVKIIVQPNFLGPNLINKTINQQAGNPKLEYDKIITRSYYGFWKV